MVKSSSPLSPVERVKAIFFDRADWDVLLPLCLMIFFYYLQPSDAYLTRYLKRNKGLRDSELDNSVWPADTYGALLSLLPFGIAAECFLGYSRTIFVGLILRIISRLILVFGSGVGWMVMMQGIYASSENVSLITTALLYRLLPRNSDFFFATALIGACEHLGSFLSSLLAQTLFEFADFKSHLGSLVWLSIATTLIAMISFFFVPSEPNSEDDNHDELKLMSDDSDVNDSNSSQWIRIDYTQVWTHVQNIFVTYVRTLNISRMSEDNENVGLWLWSVWWIAGITNFQMLVNYFQTQISTVSKSAPFGLLDALMELTSAVGSMIAGLLTVSVLCQRHPKHTIFWSQISMSVLIAVVVIKPTQLWLSCIGNGLAYGLLEFQFALAYATCADGLQKMGKSQLGINAPYSGVKSIDNRSLLSDMDDFGGDLIVSEDGRPQPPLALEIDDTNDESDEMLTPEEQREFAAFFTANSMVGLCFASLLQVFLSNAFDVATTAFYITNAVTQFVFGILVVFL